MNASQRMLSLLAGVRSTGDGRWIAKCPSHEDGTPSLSVRQVDDRCLAHCHAGCEVEEICRALGININDLFDRPPSFPVKISGRQVRDDPQRQAWADLECWRQRQLTDVCDLIRGLEHLVDGVRVQLKAHRADLGECGLLTEERHARLLDMLQMCYHELPVLEREFELINSKNRVDHLTAWRNSRRNDVVHT